MGGGAGVEAARAAHGCWQGTAAAGVGPTNPGPARQERSLAVSDGSGGCGDEVGAWRIQRTLRLMRGGEQGTVSAWQSQRRSLPRLCVAVVDSAHKRDAARVERRAPS